MTDPEANHPTEYQAIKSTETVGIAMAGERVVNKGSEQHFYGNVAIYSENGERERRERPRLSHSADQRNYLRKRFVPPAGFDRASEALASAGTVFISGSSGSGRQSTAKMLLWKHFSNNDARYRRLPLDEEEDETPLDPNSVQRNELLLLDLSIEDQKGSLIVRRRIETLRSSVEAQQAALVVVLPVEWEDQLGAEFTRPRVEINRPSSEKVLRAHLIAEDLTPPEQLPDTLDAYLTMSPMRDLERLADRIADAARTSPSNTFTEWATEASQAVAERGNEIASLVQTCDPEQRALLLSAAMLEDAHTDSAYTAHDTLISELEYAKGERHILERAGLDEILSDIKVRPTASREIQFAEPNYGKAVRDYFWTNYPELREVLRNWVERVIDQHELTDDDRHRLVSRFAAQACRTGRVEDLCTLAARWTKEGNHRKSPFAASALAYGLRDHTDAWKVRRQIYDWASNSHNAVLAHVLVAVCTDVMAVTHSERALVRLRKLAAHQSDVVARAARSALRDLAEDNSFYRRFLWRMTTWLSRREISDVKLFLTVSRAERLVHRDGRSSVLIRNRTLREQLTTCWKAILLFDESVWRATVFGCFDATATAPEGYRLLDVLVAATDGNLSPLAKLHVAARDWSCSSTNPEELTARRDVCRQLATRIDRAQRL